MKVKNEDGRLWGGQRRRGKGDRQSAVADEVQGVKDFESGRESEGKWRGKPVAALENTRVFFGVVLGFCEIFYPLFFVMVHSIYSFP